MFLKSEVVCSQWGEEHRYESNSVANFLDDLFQSLSYVSEIGSCVQPMGGGTSI